jgi:hypothetical protein
MRTEFNLSKRIDGYDLITQIVVRGDVKEFIRLLKEDTGCQATNSREEQIIELFKERIDKLAGEKR